MSKNQGRSGKSKITFHWAIWFYITILISSVMAFGAVASIGLKFDRDKAIYMLGMIPIMGFVLGVTILKIIKTLKIRMDKISDGIHRVAKGDLEVEIDLKNAGEYKSMYQNFNRMVKELKNTKIEMQNFMNDFSHEFKTPITSIQGFAELLLERQVSEEERNLYLQIIADEAERLAGLSQNTLLLSKLDAQEVVTDNKEFDLNEQIKRCTILLFRRFEEKEITLNMELSEVKYYGNMELMHQMWVNLISNAIKFTPHHGEITIIMIAVKNYVTIEITDNGIGMNEETIKHIFDKYYQGDDSRFAGGYGLGLPIVKRIAELCGGKVEVKSTPGCGSTFSVQLPLKNITGTKREKIPNG